MVKTMNTANNYRNIPFQYREWKTWNDKPASGYTCDDKSLLKHVNVVSFSAMTLPEMKKRIDYYLDNVEECVATRELNNLAAAEFYKTLYYKGD